MINSYDDGDDVVIDLAMYDDATVLRLFYLEYLRSLDANHPFEWGRPRRFVLERVAQPGADVRDATVAYTSPHICELPTIHPALYNKPYRFA